MKIQKTGLKVKSGIKGGKLSTNHARAILTAPWAAGILLVLLSVLPACSGALDTTGSIEGADLREVPANVSLTRVDAGSDAEAADASK
jgi:hypothetical protein